jgi:predicted helicase
VERTRLEQRSADAARIREAELSARVRRSEGIVHTPPELARFVACAVDSALRQQLEVRGGLGDREVAVLDPACGTGAFLAAVLAALEDPERSQSRLIGVDRDSAAIELSKQVLEPGRTQVELACADALADPPAALAPVLVAIGNPPWVTAAQAEPAPWLSALLEEARREAGGERMAERKLGVLSDAYVRFLCWAVALARGAERGAVIGFVTNGSYLDGPVHRGLRALLLRELDSLFVIDLGGRALLAREPSQPRSWSRTETKARSARCAPKEGSQAKHRRARAS